MSSGIINYAKRGGLGKIKVQTSFRRNKLISFDATPRVGFLLENDLEEGI